MKGKMEGRSDLAAKNIVCTVVGQWAGQKKANSGSQFARVLLRRTIPIWSRWCVFSPYNKHQALEPT